MRRLCAWCGKILDHMGEILPGEMEKASHGICDKCFKTQLNDIQVTKNDEIPCCHGVPGTEWCTACEAEV